MISKAVLVYASEGLLTLLRYTQLSLKEKTNHRREWLRGSGESHKKGYG